MLFKGRPDDPDFGDNGGDVPVRGDVKGRIIDLDAHRCRPDAPK
jgi:hypothetical protein